MEALAHDLRGEVPDLAGQFEESRPSHRRNTGFGLFTEMIVDRTRPAPVSGPTGDLGTVHAMVGDLPDPIAFKARLRHGVLLGLHGESYGQDTRGIDFATIAFDQVFLVNDQGRSIAFEPSRHMPPSPLLELQKYGEPVPPPTAESRLVNIGPLQKLQDAGRSREPLVSGPLAAPDKHYEALAAHLPGAKDVAEPLSSDEKVTLRVGLWVGIVALGAILMIGVGVSPIFVFVVGTLLGRFLQTTSGLRFLKRAMAELQKHAKTT